MLKKILSLTLAFSMIMSLFIATPFKASADTTVSVTFLDGDLDYVYFNGDTLKFNITGIPIGAGPTSYPVATQVRVAMGISPSGSFTDCKLFSDLIDGRADGTGWFRPSALTADGSLLPAIEGTIDASAIASGGTIMVKLYYQVGGNWLPMLGGFQIPLSSGGKPSLAGMDNVIKMPAGVTSIPEIGAGAQNVENLYSMNIAFTKDIDADTTGKISFTGLNLIENKDYLSQLNSGLVMQQVATPSLGTLSQFLMGVDTTTLAFLGSIGANVSLSSKSFLGYKTSDFDAAADSIAGGIVSGLSYDNSTYTVNLTVNHFSNYKISVKDTDSDGIPDSKDNAPLIANPDQADTDSDGIGDVADNAKYLANPDQKDTDNDGVGDVADNAPNNYNPDQADYDSDGIGDVIDPPPVSYKGEFNIEAGTGTGTGWSFSYSTLTITENGVFRVYGTATNVGSNIVVNSGLTVSITLDNVNAGRFILQDTAKATLVLKDGTTNTLRGSGYMAAVNVPSGTTLKINGDTLGTGVLGAIGSNGGGSGYGAAGIGGNHTEGSGVIEINGGVITAYGGSDYSGAGAGIGGGATSGTTLSGGSITINGGTVNAYGGIRGAGSLSGPGIGGTATTNIFINGGTVNAYGNDNGIQADTIAISSNANVCAFSSVANADPIYSAAALSGHTAYLLGFKLSEAVAADKTLKIAKKGSSDETFNITLPSGYSNFATTVKTSSIYNATSNGGSNRIFKVSDDSQDFAGVLALPGSAITYYSAKLLFFDPEAKIGTDEYLTFTSALNAVTEGQTITLLKNVSFASNIEASSKSFTIDINGKYLNVYTNTGNVIYASNGKTLNFIGNGTVDVSQSGNGTGSSPLSAMRATGANTKIEAADTISIIVSAGGSDNYGVYVENGASVKFKGSVTTADYSQNMCVFVGDTGSTLDINGNITGGWVTLYTTDGAKATITGNVTCNITNGYGVYSVSSEASITGNIKATGGGNYGVYMANSAKVSVVGSISSDSVGISAYSGSTMTLEGKVNAPTAFLQIGTYGNYVNISSYAATTTKEGYLTYTDGSSTLWLKAVYWTDGIGSTGQTPFGGGDGNSKETAYEISTVGQLAQLAYDVNNYNNYQNKYFKLTADINLSGRQWMPIGYSYNTRFQGYFNGNGHKISSLTMTKVSGADAYALFGNLGQYGTVDGVTIESGTISFSVTAGNNYFAAVVGASEGLVKNCINKANVTISSTDWAYAGGIVAYGSCDSWYYSSSSNISDCRNEGNITVGNLGFVGGIIATQNGVSAISYIRNCSNIGNITGGENTEVGGIAGRMNNSGILGITNCYNTGTITAGTSNTTSAVAGGIIGYQYYSRVKNCYNTGNVTLYYQGAGNVFAGGITGYSGSGGYTYSSYNVGTVIGPYRNGMGISGSGTFCENCYYLNTSTSSGAISGTKSLTANQMKGLEPTTINFTSAGNSMISPTAAGAFLYALDKGRYESSEYPDSFYNWASDDLGVNGGYPVFSNVHEYYIVSFDAAGGSLVAAKTIVPTNSISSEPATTKAGYTFNGWYDAATGGNKITFPYTPTASIILYAQWTQPSYTVTFDAKGGSAVEAKTITPGSSIATEPVTTKPGYTFDGWYPSETGIKKVNFPYTPTGSITLYAHWTQTTYTVTFDAKGGTTVEAQTVSSGGNIASEPVTTKSGYTFDGWYDAETGGNKITFPYTPTGSITLYAHWTVISGGGGGTKHSTADETQVDIRTGFGSTIVQGALTTTGNKQQVVITPSNFGKLAATHESINVPLSSTSIYFDDRAVAAINNAQPNGDIVISAEKLDPSSLTAEQRSKVGDRPVYDFTVTKGGVEISSFGGGHAVISIPYTLKAGEDPSKIVVYYLSATGALVEVRGRYDATTGKVTFITNHFSKYVIAYNPVSFKDVAADAWFSKAVGFIAARGITTGTGDGLFSPEATLTRGQFIVMLMRAYGIAPDNNSSDNFADAGNDYYTPYLAAAKKLGITKGIGDNKYAPNAQISRQDLFTLLYRTLEIIGELPSGSSGKTLKDFSDASSISDYALPAMTSFVSSGIISGAGGKLNPSGISTRAEMAQVLYNLLSK